VFLFGLKTIIRVWCYRVRRRGCKLCVLVCLLGYWVVWRLFLCRDNDIADMTLTGFRTRKLKNKRASLDHRPFSYFFTFSRSLGWKQWTGRRVIARFRSSSLSSANVWPTKSRRKCGYPTIATQIVGSFDCGLVYIEITPGVSRAICCLLICQRCQLKLSFAALDQYPSDHFLLFFWSSLFVSSWRCLRSQITLPPSSIEPREIRDRNLENWKFDPISSRGACAGRVLISQVHGTCSSQTPRTSAHRSTTAPLGMKWGRTIKSSTGAAGVTKGACDYEG